MFSFRFFLYPIPVAKQETVYLLSQLVSALLVHRYRSFVVGKNSLCEIVCYPGLTLLFGSGKLAKFF